MSTTQEKAVKAYTLRPHQPGDMGWIVHRKSIIYHQEYGWDETYEVIASRITADFLENFDSQKECCWIAERDGEILGSIFLVKESDTVARLRLLYVEQKSRGMGIGSKLVKECIHFAKKATYQKVVLGTHSILLSARHIYQKAGFQLIEEKSVHRFGHNLIAETWELALTP